MPSPRRSPLVYAFLAAVWLLVVGWQIEEHVRVREAAKTDLRNSSKEVAKMVGVSIRNMRRWTAIPLERLDDFLNSIVTHPTNELLKASQILSVVLLNAQGEKIPGLEAGAPIDLEQKDLLQEGEHWGTRRVILVNPVDLGAILTSEGVTNTFALPPRADFTNRFNEAPRRESQQSRDRSPRRSDAEAGEGAPVPPPPPEGGPPAEPKATGGTEIASDTRRDLPPSEGPPSDTNRPGRPREGGFRSRRPPWFRGVADEKEFQALVEKRGLHGLVLAMSTERLEAASAQDFLLRSIIVALGALAAVAAALAWRNLATSSELQIRLIRASELNTHLKEMNLAAAGLAHETRNPLNIIRGLAQMISRQPEAPGETRQEARDIIAEADKVAAQLNEFINYSRPREVRRVALSIGPVVKEIGRALGYDLDEKKISFELKGEPLSIEADEQLLRQALFNLILNAIQAVNGDGKIEVLAQRLNASEAALEVRDNGPGVPVDQRAEVFKPYFTTQKTGTGLGLAIVQQIVLAHGWEIQCLPNEPHGAIFRITHLRLAPKQPGA